MATMIPDINPESIEEEGIRDVFCAAKDLPHDYTVVFSYKFCNQITGAIIWSADLIIVHPFKGFLVFGIQEGEVGFFNGRWHEFSGGGYKEMKVDPLEQARSAAYALARSYKDKTGWNFPLSFDIGLCFPGCSKLSGQIPTFAKPDNILLKRDIEANFSAKIAEMFQKMPREKKESAAIRRLVDGILMENFKLYNTLEEQIRSFQERAQDRFTEEQQRILEETELNKRMIFYGAAGTGKTMLAVEKARRLAEDGKRTLLTCFNKQLAGQFPVGIKNLDAAHFHGLLERVVTSRPPASINDYDQYFETTLPEAGLRHFSQLQDSEKYDALVVDEGQDFRPLWISCLEAMVKKQGELYIFADSSQNIFNVDLSGLERLPVSRFRLTTNLRNTVSVCQKWIQPLSDNLMRLGLKDNGEIHFHSWNNDSEQRRLLEREVLRLVSRGISPRRITILSPNRKEKTCLAGVEVVGDLPIADVGDPRANALRFSTIRSFKGLEADVVMLIGVRPGTQVCSKADLYVGGSRARYMLHVFHRYDWKIT